MVRRRSGSRVCAFESLETRQMMAGDVTAQIHNGNLIIKGDSSDNTIAVTQSGTTITVTGTSTTVNSSTSAAVLTGFTGKIKIKMKDGADSVTLTGLTTTKLDVEMGDGNNTLDIENCTVNGKTELEGEKGNNTFKIDTKTTTGEETAPSSRFNGKLDIDLHRGNDTLQLLNATVTGEAD